MWQKQNSVAVNRKCVLSNNKTHQQNLLNTSRILFVASYPTKDCVTETLKAWVCGPKTESSFFPKWVLNDIKHFITKLSFLTPIIRIWSHCKMCFVWQKKAFRRFCLLRIVVISKPCYEMWDFERLVVHFWVNVGVCWWTFF